ncbi:DNA_cross-link repair protein [Hexamita inflata]|uniref:DNA cross-link repair protein n=1 Tax=Hexamita inflata TaxID=28002 RepID=A0AA86RDN0_9EUKA|nr:DNA cross-link repair protein [Hexamita inflata]CAI9972081.1 DNA cross-link repair protein [Hexamita inflata]
MTVHASPLTCELLKTKSKCSTTVIPLKQPVEFARKILVTAIPANHCPGSVMFLFEDLVKKELILATGDFKFDKESTECANWEHIRAQKLYVDTTYLQAKSILISQNESIKQVIDKLKTVFKPNRTKIICQTYAVGKERIFQRIAEELNIKFYPTSAHRLNTLKIIYKEQFDKYFVATDTDLGVLDVMYGTGKENVFKNMYNSFEKVVVIHATGWQSKFSFEQRGKLLLINTPYSEHCDYQELLNFCKMINPDEIYSIISEQDTKVIQQLIKQTGPKIDTWISKKNNINLQEINLAEQEEILKEAAKRKQRNEKLQKLDVVDISDVVDLE